MKATSERDGGSVGRRDIAHSSFSSVGRGRKGEREGWAGHTTPRHAAFLLISLSLTSLTLFLRRKRFIKNRKKKSGEREKRERKGDKRGLEGCEALGRARYKVRGGKRNGAD